MLKGNTDAVVKAKPGTEPGVHKLGLPANYHTGFGYKLWPTNG